LVDFKMESLVYFLIIALFLVFAAGLAGLLSLVVGLIGLVAASRSTWEENKSRRVRRASAGCAVLGAFVLLVICAGQLYCRYSLHSAAESKRRYDEAICTRMSVSADHVLVVFEFTDGTTEATLERADGSQCYIYRITSYSVVDSYLLAETPYHWHLFDLRWAQSIARFDTKAELDEAVSQLGVTHSPELLPVTPECDTRQCVPCPGRESRAPTASP
jgi:hypothetical protein